MIKINCKTNDTLKLVDMTFFQGNLKKRTDDDLNELEKSLRTEGLMMPFAVWQYEGKNLLLDGHGRKEVLVRMALADPDILTAEFPVLFIKAETEDDARKALLQITSSYGKITKVGIKQFCASIPNYRAPVINKFITKSVSFNKPINANTNNENKKASSKTVLKIRIDNDKVEQVCNILKEFPFIEVI